MQLPGLVPIMSEGGRLRRHGMQVEWRQHGHGLTADHDWHARQVRGQSEMTCATGRYEFEHIVHIEPECIARYIAINAV